MLEQEKGEWGFKALKQMVKILFKLVSLKLVSTIVNYFVYVRITFS